MRAWSWSSNSIWSGLFEKQKQQSRRKYRYEAEEDLSAIHSAASCSGKASDESSNASQNLTANQEETASIDEMLPDLDLGDLLDHKITLPSTSADFEDYLDREEKDELMSSLDLYGLFDDDLNQITENFEDAEFECCEIDENAESRCPGHEESAPVDFEQLLGQESSIEDDDTYWLDQVADKETDRSERDLDSWQVYETDVDEYKEEIDSAAESEIDVDAGLTREERALQAAIETGRSFGFSKSDIFIIVEIYEMFGWSTCRVAIERELENETEIEELRLAADIKEVWHEHFEFYSSSPTQYHVLSWPAALAIIRSFNGYPSAEEVEICLEQLFDHWSHDNIARRIHTHFGSYILSKFSPEMDANTMEREWGISLAKHFEEEHFTPPSTLDISPNAFQRNSHIHFSGIRRIS
jgi:hypothetical protein